MRILNALHWSFHLFALALHGYFSVYAYYLLIWVKKYDEENWTWNGKREIFESSFDSSAEIISTGYFTVPLAIMAMFLRCDKGKNTLCALTMSALWLIIFQLSLDFFSAVSAFVS